MLSFHENGPAIVNDNIDVLVIPPDAQDEFFAMCQENEEVYWTYQGMWFKIDNVAIDNAQEVADLEAVWPDFKSHRAKIEFSSMFCECVTAPSWA